MASLSFGALVPCGALVPFGALLFFLFCFACWYPTGLGRLVWLSGTADRFAYSGPAPIHTAHSTFKLMSSSDMRQVPSRVFTQYHLQQLVNSAAYRSKWKAWIAQNQHGKVRRPYVSRQELWDFFSVECGMQTMDELRLAWVNAMTTPAAKTPTLFSYALYEDKVSSATTAAAAHGDGIFEVAFIHAHRDNAQGVREYLVRWQDWSSEHDTWEPRENFAPGAISVLYPGYEGCERVHAGGMMTRARALREGGAN